MQIEQSQKKPFGILAILLMLVLVIYLGALTRNAFTENKFIGRSDQQSYTINITGQGKVTAIPDIAQISLGVETQSVRVENAQKDNSEKMNKLVEELKNQGISSDDIKTTNYNIYPRYNYPNNVQVLVGYTVSQSVDVKIRDLEKVGSIVEAAGKLGANQVGGLSFTIDDPEDLKQQARIKALENAKSKAESLAQAAGVKIGKIVSFNEYEAVPEYYYGSPVAFGLGGGGDAAPKIEAGSQDIIINVNVVYEVL